MNIIDACSGGEEPLFLGYRRYRQPPLASYQAMPSSRISTDGAQPAVGPSSSSSGAAGRASGTKTGDLDSIVTDDTILVEGRLLVDDDNIAQTLITHAPNTTPRHLTAPFSDSAPHQPTHARRSRQMRAHEAHCTANGTQNARRPGVHTKKSRENVRLRSTKKNPFIYPTPPRAQPAPPDDSPAAGVFDGAPYDGADVTATLLRPVIALNNTANPLACAAPSADTLISKLTIVPFCVVPFNTHAGCG